MGKKNKKRQQKARGRILATHNGERVRVTSYRLQVGSLHQCSAVLPGALGVDTCYSEAGVLWVTNGYERSQVKFCPFCGYSPAKPEPAAKPVYESVANQMRGYGGSLR